MIPPNKGKSIIGIFSVPVIPKYNGRSFGGAMSSKKFVFPITLPAMKNPTTINSRTNNTGT